jgi:hypothetical protein
MKNKLFAVIFFVLQFLREEKNETHVTEAELFKLEIIKTHYNMMF